MTLLYLFRDQVLYIEVLTTGTTNFYEEPFIYLFVCIYLYVSIYMYVFRELSKAKVTNLSMPNYRLKNFTIPSEVWVNILYYKSD